MCSFCSFSVPLHHKRRMALRVFVAALMLCAALPFAIKAQSGGGTIILSNLDKSRYPQGEMSAKFVAVDAAGNPISNVQASEIIIRENGIVREVLPTIDCPATSVQQNSIISAALSFDISGSMFRQPLPRTSQKRSLDFSNDAATQILGALRPRMDAGTVEMAVQWCDDVAVLMQNFTFSASQVAMAFPNPPPAGREDNCTGYKPCPNGNNDFTEHLLSPTTGLLNIARRGKGSSKIAILLTDAIWTPLSRAEVTECIKICRDNNIRFYAVLFGPRLKPTPVFPYAGIADSFRQIADSTNGAIYENILTNEDVRNITSNIINALQAIGQQAPPCTVRWRTSACEEELRTVTMEIRRNGQTLATVSSYQNTQYLADANARSLPALSDQRVYFKVTKTDSVYRATINVTLPPTIPLPYTLSIEKINGIDKFTVQPSSLTFRQASQPQSFTVTYTPTTAADTAYTTAAFRLSPASTGGCGVQVFVAAGLPGRGSAPTLKLTRPNGGEKFLVFSKENVTWEGLASSDVVKLEYTTDSGKTWNSTTQFWDTSRVAGVTKATLTESTSNLQWLWNPVRNTPSPTCLMRVSELSGKPIKPDDIQPRGRLLPSIRFNCAAIAFTSWPTIPSPAFEGIVMVPTTPTNVQIAFPESLPQAQRGPTFSGNVLRGADVFGTSVVGVDGNTPAIVSFGSVNGVNLAGNLSTGVNRVANAVALYADNATVNPNSFFIGFDDGVVRHFQFSNNALQLLASYGTPVASTDSSITVVRYARNKQRIVTGSVSGVIKVWSVGNTTRPLYTFSPDMSGSGRVPVTTLDVDASGDVIASGGNDGKVKLWVVGLPSSLTLGTPSQHHAVPPPNTPVVTSVRFDRNSVYIMSTAVDGYLKLWDVQTGAMLYSNNNKIPSEITAGAFSQRSTQGETGEIVIGTVRSDGLVEVWRPQIPPRPLQQDVSDAQWSIIKPNLTAQDVDMGEAFTNTTKEKLTAFITNPSSVDTVVDSVGISGADAGAFRYISGTPLLISSGATTQVEFRFSPKRTGVHTADLYVRDAFAKERVLTAGLANPKIVGVGIQALVNPLVGNATTPPTPRCIDFGKVPVGDAPQRTENVFRIETDNVSLLPPVDIGPDLPSFPTSKTTVAKSYNKGDIVILNVTFNCTKVGPTSGGVQFVFVGPDGSRQEIIIRFCGEGIGVPGRIAINDVRPSERLALAACATSVGMLSTTIASISNTGGDTIRANVRLQTPRPDVQLVLLPGNGSEAVINPGDRARSLQVLFTPTAAVAEATVNVVISTNASPNAPADRIIPVTLRRDVESFALNAQQVNFGTPPPSTTVTRPLRITNTGTVPLTWLFPVTIPSVTLGTITLQSTPLSLTLPPNGSADVTAIYTAPAAANQPAQTISLAFPAPQNSCAVSPSLTYQAGTDRALEPALATFSSMALSTAGRIVCGSLQWSQLSMTITNNSRDNILYLRLRLKDGVFFEPPSPAFPVLPAFTTTPSTLPVTITFRPPNSNAPTARPIYYDTLFVETLSGDARSSTTFVTKRDTIPLLGRLPTSLSRYVPDKQIVPNLGTFPYGAAIPTFVDVFYLENLGTEPIPLMPSPYTAGPFEVTYRQGTGVDAQKTYFTLRYTASTAHGSVQPFSVQSTVVTFNDACGQAQSKGVTLTIAPKPPDPTALLTVGSAQGRVGDTVQIPVRLTNRLNFRPEDRTVTANLSFNASVLYPIDPALRAAGSLDRATGLRTLNLSMPISSANEAQPVFTIACVGLLGSNVRTPLTLVNATMSGLPIAVAPDTATFTIVGLSNADGLPLWIPSGEQSLTLVSLTPVPVAQGTPLALEYDAARDVAVELSVTNVLGNEVVKQSEMTLSPSPQAKQGRNKVTIPTTQLQAGVYFVNIRSAITSLTRRMMVVR
jgi:WD40 repeat protein